jgi:hypothetical protein
MTEIPLEGTFEQDSTKPDAQASFVPVYRVMEACWHDDPTMRPSFEDLREELIRLESSMELMQYSAP